MRVLIVNAYSDSSSRAFSAFEAAVKAVPLTQAFTEQKQISLSSVEFDTVDVHSLSRYLYETGSVYMDKDAEKVTF